MPCARRCGRTRTISWWARCATWRPSAWRCPAPEKDMVRAMLSESLRSVISQTLLKTKDGSGRTAAYEIMIGTPAIRNLIRENKVAQMYSSIQTGQNLGMQTLDQNLQDLVRRGTVTVEEARSRAAN